MLLSSNMFYMCKHTHVKHLGAQCLCALFLILQPLLQNPNWSWCYYNAEFSFFVYFQQCLLSCVYQITVEQQFLKVAAVVN